MPASPSPLPPHTAIILVAAGVGARFGGDKLWVDLGGRPLVSWSLRHLLDTQPDHLVLVHQGNAAAFEQLDPRDFTCVQGGATRRESVLAGLAALPEETAYVLIHDAARPGVSAGVALAVAQALQTAPAALPVLPIADTIKQDLAGTITTLDRSTLHAAQTPQGFAMRVLKRALKTAGPQETDEIQAIEALGLTPALVPGTAQNMKVTRQEDLSMVRALLTPQQAMITVTGQGFDVHKFCPPGENLDRPLILGGLRVAGGPPLAGHSDADVLLHALCDGIYGALGDGDIGSHFPPSDMQWKDRDSTHFLEHALALIAANGGELVHMDLTLICETPKLRPIHDAMKQRLTALTGLPAHRIGLKATTTEGLGFPGRKEGIAAQATVTLRLPL